MDINLDFFQGNLRDNTRKEIAKQGFKSVEEFARAHDIDKSTLSRMMNANREPRLSTLLRLSLALGVSIDTLCGAQLPQPRSKNSAKSAPKAVAKKIVAKASAKKAAAKTVIQKTNSKTAVAKKTVVKKVAVKKTIAKKTAKKAGRK